LGKQLHERALDLPVGGGALGEAAASDGVDLGGEFRFFFFFGGEGGGGGKRKKREKSFVFDVPRSKLGFFFFFSSKKEHFNFLTSSMKMMHGWWSRAYPNISRISLADSPMYLSTIADATTLRKFASMLAAIARASKVLPVPGGP